MCLIQLNLQKCAKTRTKTKYPNVARGAKSASFPHIYPEHL
jgi:hypothetical protein